MMHYYLVILGVIIVIFQTIAFATNLSEIPLKTSTEIRNIAQIDAQKLDEFAFDLIKKGIDDNNTLLVVGGIQGDEPGGFMAASLVSTHYTITKGSVWIVPNLNFYSIIKKHRAPFGDMNRKFASLSIDDPEYEIVERIKKYIKDESVKLILNLHDGSGFYRPMYINEMEQPLRWGQTIVIDQELLHEVKEYNDLYTISEEVVAHTNKYLLNKEDYYQTKNTHTRFKKTFEEQEMAKTLTYFAITHGKSACGHETSKSLPINHRIYYKLLAIEKFMDIMGIEYKRNFELSLRGIEKALGEDIEIVFENKNIKLPLSDIKNIQKYFPVDKSGIIKYHPTNPLLKIIKEGNKFVVYYGSKVITKLEADFREHVQFNKPIDFIVDGEPKKYSFGETIEVKKEFLVKNHTTLRVNVIGFTTSKSKKETEISISKEMFDRRYSIEKNENIYRVEFYDDKKFVGMILVKFS